MGKHSEEESRNAEGSGLFEKTFSHDLAGLIETGADFNSGKNRIMTIMSWMFHKAEQANREITYMAAYRLGRQRGLSHEMAVRESNELTWMSHFDYSNANRPRIMQNEYAKVLLLFKNYGLNMTWRMGRDVNDALRNTDLTPEARKEAAQRFGGMMMMTAILGGISSLPLAWLVEEILNVAMGDDDEPYDAGNAFKVYLSKDLGFGPDMTNAIMRGGWDQLTGTTLSDRVSLSYLAMGREAPGNLVGKDKYHWYLEEFAGPIPGIAASLFASGSDFAQGHTDRGIEKMMPKFGRDIAKTWRFINEGALNYKGVPILPAEEFTSRDLFVQAMGFTPAKLTQQYQQTREIREMETALQQRRSYLMNQLFQAQRFQDPQAVRQTMKAIHRWNVAQPIQAIGVSNIFASAKSRNRYDLRAISGVALDPKMQYLQNSMRWAPGYAQTPSGEVRKVNP